MNIWQSIVKIEVKRAHTQCRSNIISTYKIACMYKAHTFFGVESNQILAACNFDSKEDYLFFRHMHLGKRVLLIPRYFTNDDGNSPALTEWEGYPHKQSLS